MRQVSELDLKARVGQGGPPVVVVVTRRRARAAEELVKAVASLSPALQARVDVLGIDVDREPHLCDELRVRKVPELLVFADGRLIDRCEGALDGAEASSFIEEVLGRA